MRKYGALVVIRDAEHDQVRDAVVIVDEGARILGELIQGGQVVRRWGPFFAVEVRNEAPRAVGHLRPIAEVRDVHRQLVALCIDPRRGDRKAALAVDDHELDIICTLCWNGQLDGEREADAFPGNAGYLAVGQHSSTTRTSSRAGRPRGACSDGCASLASRTSSPRSWPASMAVMTNPVFHRDAPRRKADSSEPWL